MKKAIIAFLLLVISSLGYAQEMSCLDKLMPFSRFSGFHQLSREEWSGSQEDLDVVNVKKALQSLVGSKLLCNPEDVVIKIEPVCQNIIADLPQSYVCYIFTNVGYFVVSKDKGKNINFIFGKDNKFSEPTE